MKPYELINCLIIDSSGCLFPLDFSGEVSASGISQAAGASLVAPGTRPNSTSSTIHLLQAPFPELLAVTQPRPGNL